MMRARFVGHSLEEDALELTAVYIAVPEGYIAFVEELPGANTQGATLDEVRENLKEAVELVLEANREFRPVADYTVSVSSRATAVSAVWKPSRPDSLHTADTAVARVGKLSMRNPGPVGLGTSPTRSGPPRVLVGRVPRPTLPPSHL
jgi:predicted RNase H-like HicB family nuclease